MAVLAVYDSLVIWVGSHWPEFLPCFHLRREHTAVNSSVRRLVVRVRSPIDTTVNTIGTPHPDPISQSDNL